MAAHGSAHRPSRGFTVLVAGLTALAPARAAEARWLPRQLVGHVSYEGGSTITMRSNAGGRALVAWSAPDGIRLAMAAPGSRFGASRLIAHSRGGMSPVAALAGNGDAVVAWTSVDSTYVPPIDSREDACCRRVRAAIWRRDGRFGPTQTLTPPGTDGVPDAVAVAGGRAGVLFAAQRVGSFGNVDAGSNRLRLALASVSGRFETYSHDRTIGGADAGGRSLTLGPGRATVVYTIPAVSPFIPVAVFEARLDGARSQPVSRPLGELAIADLTGERDPLLDGADAQGGHASLFVKGVVNTGEQLQLATRVAGGRFRQQTVDRIPSSFFRAPSLAVARSGLAVVTWSRGDANLRVAVGSLRARLRGAGIVRHLPAGTLIYHAATAVNSHGQAAILLTSQQSGEGPRFQAILRSTAGRYAPTRLLDGPTLASLFDDPQVVVDPRGRGVVVWQDADAVVAERFRAG